VWFDLAKPSALRSASHPALRAATLAKKALARAAEVR
jgi:hypothetical protein